MVLVEQARSVAHFSKAAKVETVVRASLVGIKLALSAAVALGPSLYLGDTKI